MGTEPFSKRVRRIFGMVVEGMPLYAVKRALEREGVLAPPKPKNRDGAGCPWSKRTIRAIVIDDVYRPHDFGEIAILVAPAVAAYLDPEKRYGVWWYNRRRTTHEPVIRVGENGREYAKRQRTFEKPAPTYKPPSGLRFDMKLGEEAPEVWVVL